MGQLALERAPQSGDEPRIDAWAEQKQAGFKELTSRHEHGVEVAVLWRKAGSLMLLGAYNDSGEQVITLIDSESVAEAIDHPAQFFSHEASDRLFNQAA